MRDAGVVELNERATADANGGATVIFNGPARGYIEVQSIAVFVTPETPRPQASVYPGRSANSGRVLASKRAGDRGTFTGTGDRLVAGQQMCVVWTGADVGAACQAILRGKWLTP